MTFTELCDHLGIPWRTDHHHSTRGFVNVDCPSCSPGWGAFRLGYCEAGKFLNCWHCGGKWLPTVLHEITRRPFGECAELAKGLTYDKVGWRLFTHKYDQPTVWDLNSRGPHWRYLQARGFNPRELCDRYGVDQINLSKELSWRVFIPVIQNGLRVSWTTRAISDDNQPRYVSASAERESVPIKHCLYNQDFVRGTAVVVEGPFDAWRVGPGAVATFGTAYSREQVLLLSKIPRRFVCYDNEPGAQRQARKLCADLSVFPGLTNNVVLSSKDPGESTDDELKSLRELLE